MDEPLRVVIREKELLLKEDAVFCLSEPEESILVAEAICKEAVKKRGHLPEVVGFVGNDFPLLANLSIQENALLPVLWHGIMSKDRAMERFQFLSEKLMLWTKRHERKGSLTEDELFRAGLLRAMMAGPSWLFIDFKTSERMALIFPSWFRELFPEERARMLISVVRPSRCPEGFQEVRLYG